MSEPTHAPPFARTPGRLAGAGAALLVAAVAVVALRLTGAVNPVTGMPFLQLLGGAAAVGLGAWFGPVIQRRSIRAAILVALGYGILVPAIVAAILTIAVPPLIPIALFVSAIAWPVTVPAAIAWLALLRWSWAAGQLDRLPGAIGIAVVASLLVAWRFTEPLVARSADEVCISIPGEEVEAIAWSRNGSWLGFATSRGYERMTLWVLDPRTAAFEVIASGPGILGEFGFVVGDDGSITFEDDGSTTGRSVFDEAAFGLWVASADQAPRRLGDLPTLMYIARGDGDITGTIELDDGGDRQALWIRSTSTGIELVQLQPGELAANPEIGIVQSLRDPFTVSIDGTVHRVAWPPDASDELSITPDHRWLMFQARMVTYEGEEAYDRLIAQNVATGARVAIRSGPHWDAELAGGRLAYITDQVSENRLCVLELDPSLGLGPMASPGPT